MRRRFLTLKARVSQFGRNKGNTRQGSDARQDWQSPLDNARTVLELLSNLGSGAINVPGLQAASKVGIQIIDIVKKIKNNKADCEELVMRIVQLLDPIRDALESQMASDIDPHLKEDLERFTRDLEKIRNILQLQANQNLAGRAANSIGDGEDILRCKELVDQGFRRFSVYTFIVLRMDMKYLRQDIDQLRSQNTRHNEGTAWQNSVSIPLPPSQPVAPEIFVGRDDVVSDLASLIVGNEQTRLAILGAGGMGKTSTALHILHHKDVVT